MQAKPNQPKINGAAKPAPKNVQQQPKKKNTQPKPRPEYVRMVPFDKKNAYAASLMHPEGYQGVRLPDGFSQKTAAVPGLVNVNIPYFPSTSNVETPGSFNFIVRPSAIHPVWIYGKQKTAKTQYDGYVDEQNTYGLFPTAETTPGISQQIGNMILQNGVETNIKYPMTLPETDWQQDPYKAKTADGSVFYGQPLNGYSVAPDFYAKVVVDGLGINVGDKITFKFLNKAGDLTTVDATATAAGQQIFSVGPVNIPGAWQTDADAEIQKSTGRPGLGVRLKATVANGHSQSVTSFHIYTVGGTPTAAKQVMFPYDLEDQDKWLAAISSFRLVSQSTLLTFMGSDLNDGGQVSSLYYAGGEHPNDLDLWNYSGIADTVNKPHSGPVKRGTYAIWKPKDTRDMQMRPLVNSEDWEHPYIVVAGVVSSADIAGMLRLRVHGNYEVVTRSMLMPQAYPPDRPGDIRQALSILREFPMAGENDSHLASIRRFLGDVWKKGKEAVQWGYDNRGWLVPAATAVASLL